MQVKLWIHPDILKRNRAYVIDNQGNRLYYGTIYACSKFIEWMKEELSNAGEEETC